MVSMHLSLFTMYVVVNIIVNFYHVLMTRLLSHGYKVNRLSSMIKKFYARHTELYGQYEENVCKIFHDFISQNNSHF